MKIVISTLIFLLFPAFLVLPATKEVIVLSVEDNIINPAIDEYIESGIKKSKDVNAEALVIKLDTPGGLLSSTRGIVKNLMKDKIPVVVYVSPKGGRAASAGTFITLSANIAAMAPSTNIGAAHPVNMGGGSSFKKKIKERIEDLNKDTKEKQKGKDKKTTQHELSSVMSEKIINDTVAWIKNIAKAREKNVDWAVKSVTESVSISEEEALDRGVIDLVAGNVKGLLRKIDGKEIILNNQVRILNTKGAEVIDFGMSIRQKILNRLTHPNIAYILMILGFYALLFEITHPGFGVPGIAGLICLIMAFYSFQVLPVNFAGLGLIILAVILFITEVFTPTFGLLTIGGVFCMVLGSFILIDSPYEFMQVSLKVIFPIVFATGAITLFLIGNVIKTRRNRISGGKEGLIGEFGVANTKITKNSGKVFVHGEIWNAVSESENVIKEAEKVEVVRVEGLKLMVSRINTDYTQIDTNNSS